jgi:putative transposase
MIDWKHEALSIRRQCQALDLPRSTAYYRPEPMPPDELRQRKRLDRIYTDHPYYGVVRMTDELRAQGESVGVARVRRLLRAMGLNAVYPKPRTSLPNGTAGRFPYLLRGVDIERPHQVWASDITYIPMAGSWAYLAAVMDWHSRAVLGWAVSEDMNTGFCLEALRMARRMCGRGPEIVNTDQGSQFTSEEWIDTVRAMAAKPSQDGRRRWVDNVMVERLWRTVKYESLYLVDLTCLREVRTRLAEYFRFYNRERRHSSLAKRTPFAVLFEIPPNNGPRGAGRDTHPAAPCGSKN